MLSKEELKEVRSNFWGDYKTIMSKHLGDHGNKINWINYKLKLKNCFLRLNADTRSASVNFDIQSKNEGVRSVIWEQLTELKNVLEKEMNRTDGVWMQTCYIEDDIVCSRLQWKLENVNFVNEPDRSNIFKFLEEVQLSFHKFYKEYGDILIELAN